MVCPLFDLRFLFAYDISLFPPLAKRIDSHPFTPKSARIKLPLIFFSSPFLFFPSDTSVTIHPHFSRKLRSLCGAAFIHCFKLKLIRRDYTHQGGDVRLPPSNDLLSDFLISRPTTFPCHESFYSIITNPPLFNQTSSAILDNSR